MSDEQGLYYEISLTSRQVLVGILLLLACVMVAFLSGVWIGRDSSPQLPTFSEAGKAPADAVAVDFFDPEADAPAAGEEEGGDASQAEQESAPPAGEEPRLSRVIPAEPEQETPAPSQGGAEATSPPPGPAETEAAAGGESVVIQVFSSHDEKQANAILERLRTGGVRAFLSPVDVNKKTMYRVRVGPFSDRTLAESEAAMLRRQYRLDTWITNHEG